MKLKNKHIKSIIIVKLINMNSLSNVSNDKLIEKLRIFLTVVNITQNPYN